MLVVVIRLKFFKEQKELEGNMMSLTLSGLWLGLYFRWYLCILK